MPGAKPGERRGGRQKGTPNKAKAAERDAIDRALAAAFAEFGPLAIDTMRPSDIILNSARAAAKAGFIREACALAKDAAPYFDPRATPDDEKDSSITVRIVGGLPDE